MANNERKCSRCGKPTTGIYCNDCHKKIDDEYKKSLTAEEKRLDAEKRAGG